MHTCMRTHTRKEGVGRAAEIDKAHTLAASYDTVLLYGAHTCMHGHRRARAHVCTPTHTHTHSLAYTHSHAHTHTLSLSLL